MGEADASKKIAAGICGILLGALGVHKFILGYTKAGIIMLLVSILGSIAFGLGPAVMSIIGIIEGIIYLTKTDDEFVRLYVNHWTLDFGADGRRSVQAFLEELAAAGLAPDAGAVDFV